MLDFNDVHAGENAGTPDYRTTEPAGDEIRAELLLKLEPILMHLLPAAKIKGGKLIVGDVFGTPGRSLEFELEGDRRGLWIDREDGSGGDIFHFLAKRFHLDIRQQFPQVLDLARGLLGRPDVLRATHAASSPIPVPTTGNGQTRKPPPMDNLGPATAKWDYLDAEGLLIACVYRYDPVGEDGVVRKEYRPWDAIRRKASPPIPRPLYNQPGMLVADTVVLVEGEKCAQALIDVGICATTAMHGANAPVHKTDWSPLKGKKVILWPDNDEAGAAYMDAVSAHLGNIASGVRRLAPPAQQPRTWDAADAIEQGFDVARLIQSATEVRSAATLAKPEPLNILRWQACERFKGAPQARRWLVQGVFPMAQPTLVAAAGGVGKSFLLLALAHAVAAFDGKRINAPTVFGNELTQHGQAVYITAEDDAIEVHNRLNALGSIPLALYTLPLPDAGGSRALFAPDPLTRGPGATDDWWALTQQLHAIPHLALVVLDPLQPLCALDLNVPENAQFVCSQLAALAASTGASVIVSHHFAKREASTPEQAREAIRGTGGLVDGMRSVYALWSPKEDQARSVCKALRQPYLRGGVVMGAVVKANGRAQLGLSTYVRSPQGLLVDRSRELASGVLTSTEADPLNVLQEAIAYAALSGKPYTKTGSNGLYERRHELPPSFHDMAKHRLTEQLHSLLAAGVVVSAMAEGSKLVKWLDVPDGPIAQGYGTFAPGHLARGRGGRPRAANAQPTA
jgi:hypothetical protein